MAAPAEDVADDEQLAGIVAGRDRDARAMASAHDAFDSLFSRHAPLLLAFIAARRPRDADDLHGEVWRKVWEHLPDKFRGGLFRAWLYRIARNALGDAGRKKSPGPIDDAPIPDPRGRPSEEVALENERADALKDCLGGLEDADRDLVRGILGGRSYVEVCPKLGLSPKQAHSRFHKIKTKLKSCLERALG